jgi:ElaB/YqjD/DUF883 family membrane-anchored ribosome-binding protein
MTTGTFKQTEQHLADGVHDGVHAARERIVEFKDEAAKRASRGVAQLGDLMREHPFIAIGAGLGVGYLLARLTHRG